MHKCCKLHEIDTTLLTSTDYEPLQEGSPLNKTIAELGI